MPIMCDDSSEILRRSGSGPSTGCNMGNREMEEHGPDALEYTDICRCRRYDSTEKARNISNRTRWSVIPVGREVGVGQWPICRRVT
jgi:hypothetical protein